MRLRRLFLCLLVTGLVTSLLVAGIAWLNNNWSIHPLSRTELLGKLDNALTASRQWVLATGDPANFLASEESSALVGNPALMLMVADCALMSGDPRLQSLVAAYFRVIPKPHWWGRLVDPNVPFERLPDDVLRSVDDYARWFLHAVMPAEYPLTAEDRANMFSPDKYRTGSATHQLLALHLYRKHNGANPHLDWLIRHISLRIASEAAIDFRVTDLYLQRIAFLLAAGQQDLVKRRWVERVFGAQQPDGGWSYSWHGWQPTPFGFRFGEAHPTSHSTVQGMWITYMFKYRYPKWIENNYQ